MGSVIVFDQFDPPVACKSCPFLNDEINCCDLLSRVKGKAVLINKYSSSQDIRCPFRYIDDDHGRLLDEKDIRACFATAPFSSRDIRYSMLDIFNNLSGVREVAPRHIGRSERVRQSMVSFGESIKRFSRSPKDIQKEIESVGKDNKV